MAKRLNLTQTDINENLNLQSGRTLSVNWYPPSDSTEPEYPDLCDTKEEIAMDCNRENEGRKLDPDSRKQLAHLKRLIERGTAFEDDKEAPPVNIPLLRRFLTCQTTLNEDQKVEKMLEKYRPWVESLRQLEVEQKGHGDVPPSPT